MTKVTARQISLEQTRGVLRWMDKALRFIFELRETNNELQISNNKVISWGEQD